MAPEALPRLFPLGDGTDPDKIGRLLGVHPSVVHCPMIGEHGENVVPVFSRVRVDGEPATVPAEARDDVREYVRDIPFEIAKARGVEETSRWVTSAGVTRVIRSMVTDRRQRRGLSLNAARRRVRVHRREPRRTTYAGSRRCRRDIDVGALGVRGRPTAGGVRDSAIGRE